MRGDLQTRARPDVRRGFASEAARGYRRCYARTCHAPSKRVHYKTSPPLMRPTPMDFLPWSFAVRPEAAVQTDPFEEEFFIGPSEGELDGGHVDSLVRESIQNALDARTGSGPVRVKFRFTRSLYRQPIEVVISTAFARTSKPWKSSGRGMITLAGLYMRTSTPQASAATLASSMILPSGMTSGKTSTGSGGMLAGAQKRARSSAAGDWGKRFSLRRVRSTRSSASQSGPMTAEAW